MRFEEKNLSPISLLYNIICNEFQFNDENMKVLSIYDSFISFDRLKAELVIWNGFKKDSALNDFEKIRNIFVENKQTRKYFPEIFKIIKIYLSIPCSNAESERSFSCLKRL